MRAYVIDTVGRTVTLMSMFSPSPGGSTAYYISPDGPLVIIPSSDGKPRVADTLRLDAELGE